MNFVILALVGVLAASALWAMRVSQRLWTLGGAVLMLGATGFAVQSAGHLPGKPVTADVTPIPVDPGMVAFRDAVFSPSYEDSLALATADARLTAGDAHSAAQGLQDAITLRPDDAMLWTGLGYVLSLRDHAVSPAAKFAFRRALTLAPHTPGPAFFLGLAYVDAGDLANARSPWVYALAQTPAGAPYRGDIAERIAAIDQFQKTAAAQRGPAAAP